jgi:NAD+ synthase (glutamine-hydrolysing)
LKTAIAQIDPVVGAFEANVRKIREAYAAACAAGARVLLTPELGVCGYPPHDLIDRPEIFERNERAVDELAAATKGQSCALAVGHVARNPSERGRAAQNVASVLEGGKRVFSQAKTLLPTYDVFDEARYFEPAAKVDAWLCDGVPIALSICEDLWANDPAFGRKLYGVDPVERYRELGVKAVFSLSSSPYVFGKQRHREELHGEVARKLGVPLVYVNQVGATDEILFDGGSFALNSMGALVGRLPVFRTAFGVLDVRSDASWLTPGLDGREDGEPSEMDWLCRGLVTGIREYFVRTGFKTAVIGLSGGIDSAVVAVLAAQALGPERVLAVAMPSQYSSGHSMEDAESLAKSLGIHFEARPIKFLFAAASRELAEKRGTLAPVALENLQSRMRGMFLMTLANHYSALVLTTGNKSELATGYCTLYGDMVGALAPIGDVLKTQVYALARHMNLIWGNPIPERSLTKPPSAELKPNQTDQDTLPPYDDLDALLADYIERGASVADLEAAHGKRGKAGWVRDVLRRLEINEYKRRQAAPVLKISTKAFGIGRRIPIAKIWDQ